MYVKILFSNSVKSVTECERAQWEPIIPEGAGVGFVPKTLRVDLVHENGCDTIFLNRVVGEKGNEGDSEIPSTNAVFLMNDQGRTIDSIYW